MNDLKHIGILGMKWGRRKSSSSTESSDHKAVGSLKKKKLSELTNDELKKLTTRLQLEKQMKDLSKKDLSGAKKFISDVIVGSGKQLATKYVSNFAEGLISSISSSIVIVKH